MTINSLERNVAEAVMRVTEGQGANIVYNTVIVPLVQKLIDAISAVS